MPFQTVHKFFNSGMTDDFGNPFPGAVYRVKIKDDRMARKKRKSQKQKSRRSPKLFRGCDDLIFPEESDLPLIISPKKSLSSWIKRVAHRAGVEFWQKPFQNLPVEPGRDTELRKMFPEYLVNR